MARNGTGYSYIGVTELSSAYCPICAERTLQLPAKRAPRAIYSEDLCCSAAHQARYQERIKAVCCFVLETTVRNRAVQRHMKSGNITVLVGAPLANIIDIIEIVKGKVRIRKDR